MALEAAVLRSVATVGAPVAAVVASGVDGEGANFIVCEAIEGETIARKILRDPEYAGARDVLLRQLAGALATIHTVDPAMIDGLPDVDQVGQYRQLLDVLGAPHPTFELVLRWLDAHRPVRSHRSLVHGDFRLGNMIVGPDGLRAVLDWELAHAGDPMEDLGWLCVRAWRFGSEHPAAGLGEYAELFAAYEEAGGDGVDPDVVRWWEVLGTLKWGVMCIVQAETHRSGRYRSHELAAIGRRVCETEYDLFLALEGRWS